MERDVQEMVLFIDVLDFYQERYPKNIPVTDIWSHPEEEKWSISIKSQTYDKRLC